ncbi:MAG: hypothetical protein IH627_11910 [Rubrivivax sp.]|nr:hypothetical protein [Rubrivivax sp.]
MALPPELLSRISEAICRPVGTVAFEFSSSDAFRVDAPGGIIVEIPSGGHYFKLERTQGRRLNFYHSSPGTGTRLASIDLAGVPSFERALLAFVWSPEEVRLHCAPKDIAVGMLKAVGTASPMSIRVGTDGSVFQLGDAGVQVLGVRIQRGRDVLLASTAREAWDSTLQAVTMLWTGTSDQGFMFEVLQATTTLSMLVTGLESYAETRLIEIESEGIKADPVALFSAFCSKAERESARISELEAMARDASASLLSVVADNIRLNFQDFGHLKRAFRATYGIRIGDLGVKPHEIEAIRRFIQYRHRVVHVSPLLAFLNQDSVPPDEPVFANRALADQAVEAFCNLVNALHAATTALRPVA